MLSDVLFFVAALPLCLLAGLSDLRTMTIPNWISIALVAVFTVIALIMLPFETVLWRLGAAAVMLAIGFVLNSLRVMGGGDAKLLAAIAPFIPYQDVAAFMFIFSVSLLSTLLLHRIAMRIKPLRRATPDWASWEAGRNFPMGISIAAAILIFLALKAFNGG